MNGLCAYDVDGTTRSGSLVTEAINHGIEAEIVDPARIDDPTQPTRDELRYFVQALAGHPQEAFKQVLDRLSDEAPSETMPWALDRIASQKRNEQHILLLSLSPGFLVRAYGRGLGVNHAQGSQVNTSQRTFTGLSSTLDKQRALSRYLRRWHISSVEFAAGDSESDLPMLVRAEHAVVVNPCQLLGQLAVRNNWEIIRTREEVSP